jgi:hypothetical protein
VLDDAILVNTVWWLIWSSGVPRSGGFGRPEPRADVPSVASSPTQRLALCSAPDVTLSSVSSCPEGRGFLAHTLIV